MKKKNAIIILPFSLILVCLMIYSFSLGDKGYSIEESRALKTRETMDLKDPSKLSDEIEDYLVDQFPYREELLKVYSEKDKLLGKKFTRSVYIDKDNWLFVESSVQPMNGVSSKLGDVLERHPNKEFYYMIIPSKTYALKDRYSFTGNTVADKNYENLLFNLNRLDYKNFKILDTVKTSQEKESLNDDKKWYRTDFHWNAYGAITAADQALAIMKSYGDIDNLRDPENISLEYLEDKEYVGDLNRRFSYIYGRDEHPLAINNINGDSYEYYLDEAGEEKVSREDIIGKDLEEREISYGGVYTPNLAYYRIVNDKAVNDESLLIIKDSMQNPTTDVFAETFRELRVVDPRFIEAYSFDELVNNVDKIIFLQHQSNDMESTGEFISR